MSLTFLIVFMVLVIGVCCYGVVFSLVKFYKLALAVEYQLLNGIIGVKSEAVWLEV